MRSPTQGIFLLQILSRLLTIDQNRIRVAIAKNRILVTIDQNRILVAID